MGCRIRAVTTTQQLRIVCAPLKWQLLRSCDYSYAGVRQSLSITRATLPSSSTITTHTHSVKPSAASPRTSVATTAVLGLVGLVVGVAAIVV